MAEVAEILKLPGGFELRTPPGENRDHVMARHVIASVCEGICPYHQRVLVTIADPPRHLVAGRCLECRRYWAVNREAREWQWQIDHDPHSGQFEQFAPTI